VIQISLVSRIVRRYLFWSEAGMATLIVAKVHGYEVGVLKVVHPRTEKCLIFVNERLRRIRFSAHGPSARRCSPCARRSRASLGNVLQFDVVVRRSIVTDLHSLRRCGCRCGGPQRLEKGVRIARVWLGVFGTEPRHHFSDVCKPETTKSLLATGIENVPSESVA